MTAFGPAAPDERELLRSLQQGSLEALGVPTLKTYPGFPHGMLTTHADILNADLLAFIKG